jgi:phosphocarrier protein
LTQLAKSFVSHVELALHRDGPWIDAKSPVKIMRVKASKGSMLYFRARGPDAGDAIASLVALVDRRFDEDEHETGERAHG